MTYTTEQINDAGRLLSEHAVTEIERVMLAPSVYRTMFTGYLPPLTRRQRLRGRLQGYRYRISMAVDVLRGRHDCEY
jgi:hypothetical protein